MLDNAILISKIIDEFDPKTVNNCLPSPIQNFEKELKSNFSMVEPLTFTQNNHRKHSISIAVNNQKIKPRNVAAILTPRIT